MKKLPAVFAALLAVSAFAQEIKFEDASFKNLLTKAKQENKVIFMDAYASWCGPCKLMAKNVFTKPAVADFYNSKFINSKFDMEKGEGADIAKKYSVKAYPTYLFINGDGEILYRGTGYYEENDFINIGTEALDPTKNVAVIKKRFEAGEKDPAFLKNFMKVFMFSDRPLAEKAAERYFTGLGNQPVQKDDLQYLFELTPDSNSPLYTFIQNRKPELTMVIPEVSFNKIMQGYQFKTVMNKAYNKDTKQFSDQIFLSEAGKIMSADDAKNLMARTKMNIAKSNKNYLEYQKLSSAYYGDGSADRFTSDELNSVAWDYFEKIDDKNALKTAIGWAQQSVKKEEGYANTDTLANLYYKAGDKAKAKLYAEKAIELAKKEGEDFTDTQKLLDKVK